MEKIHAIFTALQAMMLFKIIGIVPVYFPVGLLAAAMLNQAIKVAKWTTAQRGIELAFRAVLKIPVVGVWIAAIPLLGDLLHYLANDTANLPPTALMRIKAKKQKKAAAAAPVAPAVAILLIGFMTLSGCGFCSKAANKDTARCKAQNVATDCAAPEVSKLVLQILPQVAAALASNDYSKLLDFIVADLTKAGQTDGLGLVLCAIDKIEGQPTAAKMDSALTLRATAYKAAHKKKAK